MLDVKRERLIIGKTRAQLDESYPLLEADQVTAYYRDFYRTSAFAARHVAFLRGSAWMVVFEDDRAVDLVLIKGW